MAEVVSGEEGIEEMRAPPVDRLCVGMRGSWAYRKQGDGQILIDSSFFCGWRSYPPLYFEGHSVIRNTLGHNIIVAGGSPKNLEFAHNS